MNNEGKELNKNKNSNDIISFTLFSHEYYLLTLPSPSTSINDAVSSKQKEEDTVFFKDFPFYNAIVDCKKRRVSQVPVIRLYGNDIEGNSICLHVHGVFIYLIVPSSSPSPNPKSQPQPQPQTPNFKPTKNLNPKLTPSQPQTSTPTPLI